MWDTIKGSRLYMMDIPEGEEKGKRQQINKWWLETFQIRRKT